MTDNECDGKLTQCKYLWEDPLADWETRGPVLLAEEIWEYATKYNILFKDKNDLFKKDLKGASYSMRPHPEDAYYFDDEGNQKKLEKLNDESGEYHLVKKNSLVYIKLAQCLVIPYYIIGRQNLKISYVYQGLLLGTGPQVDPGFEGNMFIPLHNLTNIDVKIYINKSFVSIDFVRTSSLVFDNSIPDSREAFERDFPEMKPFPADKLKRVTLNGYLKGVTPSSSLKESIKYINEIKEKNEKDKQTRKWVTISEILGGLILFITTIGILIGMMFSTHQIFTSIEARIDKNVYISGKNSAEAQTVNDSIKKLVVENEKINSIAMEYKLTRTELNRLGKKVSDLESYINTTMYNVNTEKSKHESPND